CRASCPAASPSARRATRCTSKGVLPRKPSPSWRAAAILSSAGKTGTRAPGMPTALPSIRQPDCSPAAPIRAATARRWDSRIVRDNDYPASWYAATRDRAAARPPLSDAVRADVAVVGGGFAGLHTARLLARRGLSVVLVERRRIGWGASGRNGGFVGRGSAHPARLLT